MMGFWGIVLEVLMKACAIVSAIFAFFIGVGLLIASVHWLFFLLQYPMMLMFWMLEKILPPFPRQEERTQRREPEPPHLIKYDAPRINEAKIPIQEEIKKCLSSHLVDGV